MKLFRRAVIALLAGANVLLAAAGSLDLGTARLTIEPQGKACLEFADGARWPASEQPALALEAGGTNYPAQSTELAANRLVAQFANGARVEFRVTHGQGFALFELAQLQAPQPTARFRLFLLPAPAKSRVSGTVNGATFDGNFAAVMAAKPNVHAFNQSAGGVHSDRAGCSHELTPVAPGKVGARAARFTARADSQPGGWSVSGEHFPVPLDLTGCRALRAWIHGDGRGEALKIQLYDGLGGYRDNYVTIDFQGWRQVTLTNCPINTLHYDHVSALNLYFNSLPASTTVTCLVDHVEALVEHEGKTRAILLEDFTNTTSPLWSSPTLNLCAQTEREHQIEPAAFGVIACRETNFLDVVQRFEVAARLPHPQPGGVWNKRSPRTKRSYLFLTNFRQTQFNQALALAQRGGFDTILLGQESWSRGTGHYQINRERFPEGLIALQQTIQRFKENGFHVGLHFLAASVYPPDPYLTPVPDSRLVKGATAALATNISATADFLPTAGALEDFPAEDGGYLGQGTVLQIGDELVRYAAKAVRNPWGFSNCKRGYLGTRPVAHQQGEVVRHLVRAYGYHLFDQDTSLLEEVAANFARAADACHIDMVYFDGSERLQGEHWYYNARLHQAFYDQLANKDLLFQASSCSHYSWHLLARSASADGHGDLKGYLDQRSGGFDSGARDWMPLDIGWYYGYDPTATPDLFEYVLGATLGYDSSMSFQVSCEAAAAHPFTGEILDLIARYERLRLSGKVPERLSSQMRIDSALTAIKPGDAQPELVEKRREYRLMEQNGRPFFQRVNYQAWHQVDPDDTHAANWTLRIQQGPARMGVQIHAPKGAELVDPWVEVAGQRWTWQGRLSAGEFVFFWPGEPIRHYKPGQEPEVAGQAPELSLPPGEYPVAFGSSGHLSTPVRVRFIMELPQRLEF